LARVSSVAETKPNTVEREKLEPNKFYVQIGNVEVFLDPNDPSTANRITAFDRNFNINSFIFEAAHAASGKQQTETSQQQKKKIVFKLDNAFPSLRSRLEVVDKQQIILSPIENAIELITERIQKLKVELNSRPSRINSLQQVLQGSVVPSKTREFLFLMQTPHHFFFLSFLQWLTKVH